MGGTVYVVRARDAILSIMELRPDVHTGRIALKLSDNLEEWASAPLINFEGRNKIIILLVTAFILRE